jgi:hypothetical protein
VHPVDLYVPATQVAAQGVALTPLQKLLAGQAPHTLLVVAEHVDERYWFEAQVADEHGLQTPGEPEPHGVLMYVFSVPQNTSTEKLKLNWS